MKICSTFKVKGSGLRVQGARRRSENWKFKVQCWNLKFQI